MSRRRLIAERDVQRAARDGASSLDGRNATITPSALDLAARLGIAVDRDEPAGRRLPRGSRPAGDTGSTRGLDRGRANVASPPRPASEEPAVAVPVPSTTPANPVASRDAPPRVTLRLALGADHGGVAMKDALRAFVTELGHDAVDLGTTGSSAVDYPDFAIAVARTVADGRADLGIMVDGAGIGSCMAANKVAGVRAAMCYDVTTAANAREHNDANVLTLGGTLLGQRLAQEIVRTFLQTQFGGGRHAARVGKIDALDAVRRG